MPGGDLPLKNNEYINEALENSRVEAENNSDELTPEEEIAEDTPEGSEQSLPDENESKALLDEPTLFDENECETPFDESPLFDEDEIETQIDEASLPIDDTEAIEEDIKKTAAAVPGVEDIHNLQTRRNGISFIIDAHVVVDPTISVVQAHDIATAVEDALRAKYGTETQISIHIEPGREAK
jgi:hypothetical protein